MFDVENFLIEYHIPYTTTKDGVVISCPWCGSADPGQHLAWNSVKGWHCWRNSEHAGRKPHRLICRLIGCAFDRASEIVSIHGSSLDVLDRRYRQEPDKDNKPTKLLMPKEFRSLSSKGAGLRYAEYLINKRGFRKVDIPILAEEYSLKFATSGPQHHRIIFPLYFKRKLVCWTGRTISLQVKPRYLTLGDDDVGIFRALQSPKSLIYNYDQLRGGGKVLVLVEGPLDALKMDLYGRSHGVRTTCLFGTGITIEQVDLIKVLMEKFDKLVIIGDQWAESNVWHIHERLLTLRPSLVPLPNGVEDPGALSRRQAIDLTGELL
jgi:hypothetical protein